MRSLGLLFLLLAGVALAQPRTDLKGIVPGDALGWEVRDLRASVVVGKPTLLNLQIYSPGFDPNDYRRGLRGGEELGDERYDGGRGELVAEFTLARGEQIVVQKTYGVEPHRWDLFFRGPLEPGVYTLSARFSGRGKNAFLYRIQTREPDAAELLVEPGLQLYDVRGRGWVEPLHLLVEREALPVRVGFYDEDGPREMEARVRLPDGRAVPRPVSGDRGWAHYEIRQPGLYTFGFRRAPGATQHSNTIGVRLDACVEVEREAFRVVAPRPVSVRVVDTEGRPLRAPTAVEGGSTRTVRLASLPEGYRLFQLEARGGEHLGGGVLRFGCAGGEARFVLEKHPEATRPPVAEPEPPATLELGAALITPSGEEPFPLSVRVGERRLGPGRYELPPGSYTLMPELEGARVEGPSSVRLESGEVRRIIFRVYPEVQLSLEASRTTLRVGEEATLTARVRTAFPHTLPAEIEMELPPCLEALGATRLTAPVAGGRDAVLALPVRAACRGELEVEALLAPWGQRARTRLHLVQPAAFTLEKEALSPTAAVGEEVVWRLRVRNTGDEAGSVRVQDSLAAGLQGLPLDQNIKLLPGEERTLEVRTRVTSEAPPTLTNTARLLDEQGQTLVEVRAGVRTLRAVAGLSRSLDKRVVVPGEEVEVRLVVRNTGEAPLRYTLEDAYPEWLEVDAPPRFSGELAPGGSAVHTYRARVRFGAPAEGAFQARLQSNGGDLSAPDRLQRTLVHLEKAVEPARVLVGSEATFTLRVGNPTDHPITLSLLEAPGEGLALRGNRPSSLTLEPGETREVRFEAKAEQAGALENGATAFVNGTPASFPARATLTALPPLAPTRVSTVRLEFRVKGTGDRLLLTHRPPEGGQFEPGSARLDGRPLEDPRVDGEGRLYFELPYQAQGVVSYELRHREALPALEAPTLTLRMGDREVYLQGQQTFASLQRARPTEVRLREGFIQEPLPGTVFRVDRTRVVLQTPYGLETRLTLNGQPIDTKNLGEATYDEENGRQTLQFYGVPLQEGRNLIEVETPVGSDRVEVFLVGRPVRLEVRPLRLLADGRTPLELEVRALDALGLTAGFGPVTVETNVEPLEPDAFPLLSGYQVPLKDGQALLRLRPTAAPTPLRLRLTFEGLSAQAEFFALGRQEGLWQLQGSAGVRLGESIQAFGMGRGYLEAPLEGGVLRAALDGSLRFEEGRPQVESGLRGLPDPTGRFPLTGAGSEAQRPLPSNDPVALRYDREGFSLGYFADQLSVFGLSELPQGTALRLETRQDLALQGFAGWLPVGSKTDLIVPDGTRFYKLSGPAEPGSEQVVLLVGASERRLERLKDYVLDASSGILTLSEPLWPSSSDFQPVRLRVVYAPLGGARELGYGAGARWRVGDFSIGAGAAYLPGNGWRYGAEAAYQLPGFGLRATYSRGSAERFGLELSGKNGPLESTAHLSYGGKLQGQAQVAYRLSEADRVSLEHQTGETNRTGLLYTRRLNPAFSVGGGLGYTWETATLLGLGRLGFSSGPLNTELTHAQPFSLTQSAATRLRSSYAFDANLSAEADLTQTWGLGLSGSLGLKQKLGSANLALAYQLPGASGEGNRARFGLEAPLPLTDGWSLNASAGYERSLSTGSDQLAFGLALRYQAEQFSATLGAETAWAAGQPKLVWRAGATGQLDAQQTLSLDANYQILPVLEGRFTLAYALRGRDASLLSYHRLNSGSERVLEGALATSYHPSLSFQLRPSLAYRLKLDDPTGHTYGLGLGGNYYLTDWLGLGAAVYYQLQPGTQSSATAWSLEASFRLVEGLWLNAGYTLGGFVGPTPETAPGFYLRFDFLGGSR